MDFGSMPLHLVATGEAVRGMKGDIGASDSARLENNDFVKFVFQQLFHPCHCPDPLP